VLKISELDSKILKYLLQDGRKGFAEIAEECRVTKNKIWKRYMAMERKGIIKGATIQMNFGVFGYEALATLLINVEAQQIDRIMEYVEKITEIRAYRQYNSVYNIRAVTTLRSLNQLDQIKRAIRQKLPMMSLRTSIWTDVRNMPENLNLTRTCKTPDEKWRRETKKEFESRSDRVDIDDLDLQILEKLTKDGRASFNQIAREIGTSTDTIVKRYHRMKKNGAIKISLQIDPKKIGYSSILDFNISFTLPGIKPEAVVESLAKIPDVIIITKTSGDFDLQLTAMVRDIEQSFDLQDQIARTCGVTKMEASARKIPESWPTPQQHISTF